MITQIYLPAIHSRTTVSYLKSWKKHCLRLHLVYSDHWDIPIVPICRGRATYFTVTCTRASGRNHDREPLSLNLRWALGGLEGPNTFSPLRVMAQEGKQNISTQGVYYTPIWKLIQTGVNPRIWPWLAFQLIIRGLPGAMAQPERNSRGKMLTSAHFTFNRLVQGILRKQGVSLFSLSLSLFLHYNLQLGFPLMLLLCGLLS